MRNQFSGCFNCTIWVRGVSVWARSAWKLCYETLMKFTFWLFNLRSLGLTKPKKSGFYARLCEKQDWGLVWEYKQYLKSVAAAASSSNIQRWNKWPRVNEINVWFKHLTDCKHSAHNFVDVIQLKVCSCRLGINQLRFKCSCFLPSSSSRDRLSTFAHLCQARPSPSSLVSPSLPVSWACRRPCLPHPWR